MKEVSTMTEATSPSSLNDIARALNGKRIGNKVRAPGMGCSPRSTALEVSIRPDGTLKITDYTGADYREVYRYVHEKLGIPFPKRQDLQELRRDARQRTRDLQKHTTPATEDSDGTLVGRIERALDTFASAENSRKTLVELYLVLRGLELSDAVAQDVIRFHPRACWKLETGLMTLPTMVSLCRCIYSDEPRAIRRLALHSDGTKLRGQDGKTLRFGLGPVKHTAVKIDSHCDITNGLTIGEGVETCLAARQLGYGPVWAVGDAGGIADFPVLKDIETLTILLENDANGTNQRAAERCMNRWRKAGREVVLVEPLFGNDVNDALKEGL
jgi:hypothetical protein